MKLCQLNIKSLLIYSVLICLNLVSGYWWSIIPLKHVHCYHTTSNFLLHTIMLNITTGIIITIIIRWLILLFRIFNNLFLIMCRNNSRKAWTKISKHLITKDLWLQRHGKFLVKFCTVGNICWSLVLSDIESSLVKNESHDINYM